MALTRRSFLTSSLALAAAGSQRSLHARQSTTPLRLLVIGGTGFLGPHVVEHALARGHALTLFNRGRTNPTLFAGKVEQLRGDRKTDLSALERGTWDAVIDTSAYIPADVTRVATLLAPRVKHYQIISSISVYANFSKPGMDETHPLAQLADPTVEQVTGETYGGLKALCEQAAERALPGRTLVIRPGLIVGPGDPTDRFTYWPVRVGKGGDVLAPNSPDEKVQCIDVRDLAQFMIHTLEQKTTGIFNADAPAGSLTMGRLLDTCRTVSKSDARMVWVPTDVLEKHKVRPWADMPVWIPAQGDEAGQGQISTAKAQAAGLTYRPLDTTVADTLAWVRTWPQARRDAPLKAGITPAREAEVLAAWKASRG
jgi:2'-hydroxyisoflavone reductase